MDEHLVAPRPHRHLAGLSGWAQAGTTPQVHHGLPSPWLTFIVTLHDPLVVAAHPDPAQRPDHYEALLGGLHTRPALITHGGRQSGVQLSVHPLAARGLLGVPAGELADRDEHAVDVLGPWVQDLQDRLRTAVGWPERFAVVAEELAGRPELPVVPELRRAWALLTRTRVPVAEVAADVGWSARRLHTRCRAETGLSPQELRRVTRFDRARRALAAGATPSSVAADHGYTDQPHLTREFSRFAGLPPRRWLAAEGRSVQDTVAPPDAG
ncbi:AraC-type DNA-binding protein [Klenkia soli]|uniref:AraC-type DNA-binding protein n=1 Tax=Klenkia soli TaxID=1052260 RepID=A0A1H0T171_9ACTN|nr:AraC-type DNA-binding protein [Klenkia soli]